MIPGHKLRADLVGGAVAGDLSLWGHLAPMRDAAGVLVEAEALAAQLWGADWCRFSVGGSTHGNQALALAVGQPGDEVVITRAVHRSLLLGFVLAGLRPVWVAPPVDPVTGLPGRLPVDAVRGRAARAPGRARRLRGRARLRRHPLRRGGLAAAAHDAGVPLVVDQAWAAHFGFHPALPPHALTAGADAFVTSAHKTLPSYTQARARARADLSGWTRDRLERAFEATHTTSPAGHILASIDAARCAAGARRRAAARADHRAGRRRAAAAAPRSRGCWSWTGPADRVDPTTLVVGLAGTGADGLGVEADLARAASRRDGRPGHHRRDRHDGRLPPSVQPSSTGWSRRSSGTGRPRRVPPAAWLGAGLPEVAMPPREAFFAPHETVPAPRAAGRVAAELIAPYPPGIPAVVPGEVVSAEVLEALREAAAAGVRVAYAADPTLATVQVVARR